MIRSMTGYGRAVETVDGRVYTVEIRSVNNRYLDCGVKMPRAYSFAEDAVKQRVKASVTRGKVDVMISVAVPTGEAMKISLNRPVLEGYLAAMKEIANDYQVRDDISVTSLTRFSVIFVVEEAQADGGDQRGIHSVISTALHMGPLAHYNRNIRVFFIHPFSETFYKG